MPLRELATRTNEGIHVTLHFDTVQNECLLEVDDENGKHYTVIANDKALDAFQHPYCYDNYR